MPTYQYACTECDHSFEQFQSFSDDALTVCPQCQGRLRKVFNAVGVVFKGSGFYRTDSRKDAVPSNGNGTSGSESGGKSDSTTSSSTGDGSGSGTSSSTASTGAKPAGGTPAASSKSSAA